MRFLIWFGILSSAGNLALSIVRHGETFAWVAATAWAVTALIQYERAELRRV